MHKASSAFLATAGVTMGLLGFALPAGAATGSGGGSGSAPTVTKTLPTGGGNNNQGDKGRASRWCTSRASRTGERTAT